MKRRQLIIGIGGTAGLGSAIGTGAFTSVSAERDVTVETADDANALLAMKPLDTPNGNKFATTESGLIVLDFSTTDAGGSGLGADSVYDFDDIFQVTNQGTQPFYLWATFSGVTGSFEVGTPNTDIWLYTDGDPESKLRDSADEVRYLTVGASADIGVHVDTDDLDEDQNLTITITAAAEKPTDEAGVVGSGPTRIEGPTDGLANYWPLDHVGNGTAEDTVSTNDGSTTGNGVTAAGSGKVRAAAAFDTSDDYVQVDQSPEVTPPFSLAVWLNASGFDQTKYPLAVSKWQQAQNRDYLIGYHGVEDKLYTQFNREPNGNKTTLFGPSPSTDKWYHCVLTYAEDTTGRFYVDGTEVDSAKGAFNNTTSKLVIGSKDGGGNPWHGRIDDVRIYNRVLSNSEVTVLYDATK